MLERGEEQKFLSKNETVEIPIVAKYFTVKIDLTVMSFLHDVDMVVGFNLLRVLYPLMD